MNQCERTEKSLSIILKHHSYLAPVFPIVIRCLPTLLFVYRRNGQGQVALPYLSVVQDSLIDVSAVTLWKNMEHLWSPVQRHPGVPAKQEQIWSRWVY